jgi:3-hydroxyacyl-[acyl-carrier-protein] dehydratase
MENSHPLPEKALSPQVPHQAPHQVLNIDQIMALLPHRSPFLLIDRVIEVEPRKRIVAIKNVTINEPFFEGHFPGYPIMPGVLVVEAMAQAGGVLVGLDMPNPGDKLMLFTGVDGAKFRKEIRPGDQLRIEVTILRLRSIAVRLEGKAFVDGKLACEATLSCGIVSRKQASPNPSVESAKPAVEEASLPSELQAVTTE